MPQSKHILQWLAVSRAGWDDRSQCYEDETGIKAVEWWKHPSGFKVADIDDTTHDWFSPSSHTKSAFKAGVHVANITTKVSLAGVPIVYMIYYSQSTALHAHPKSGFHRNCKSTQNQYVCSWELQLILLCSNAVRMLWAGGEKQNEFVKWKWRAVTKGSSLLFVRRRLFRAAPLVQLIPADIAAPVVIERDNAQSLAGLIR